MSYRKNVSKVDCQVYAEVLAVTLPALDFGIDEQRVVGDMMLETANRLGAQYYFQRAEEEYVARGLYQFFVESGHSTEDALERLASALASEPAMFTRMVPLFDELRKEGGKSETRRSSVCV